MSRRLGIVLALAGMCACASEEGVRIPGQLRVELTDATIADEPATYVETRRNLHEAAGIDSVDLIVETDASEHRLRIGSAALRAALMGAETNARLDGSPVTLQAREPLSASVREVELVVGQRNTEDVFRIQVGRAGAERRPTTEVSRPDDSPDVNEEMQDLHDFDC